MSFKQQSQKKLVEQTIRIFPSFISEYPETARPYLIEFYDVILDINLNTSNHRKHLMQKQRDYCSHVKDTPEYPEFPFLWFCCSFVQNLTRLVSLKDFHANEYYQHFSQVALGRDSLGLIKLLRDLTPLTDPQWEKLQHFCLCLIPILNTEDILLITELIRLSGSIQSLLFFCPKELQRHLETTLRLRYLSRKLDKLFTRLSVNYYLSWNFEALNLSYIHLEIEPGRDTTLLSVFGLKEGSIFDFQWIYHDLKRNRCYVWLVIPEYYYGYYSQLFQQLENQDLCTMHSREKFTEYGHWNSLIHYPVGKELQLPPLTKFLTEIRKIPERTLPAPDLPISLIEHHPLAWRLVDQPDLGQLMTIFCQNTPTIPVDYFTQFSNPYLYTPEKFAAVERLTVNQVINPFIVFQGITLPWAAEEYMFFIPKEYLRFVPHLLQFLPFGIYGVTKTHVILQAFCPPQLINHLQKETTHLKWSIRPIVARYYAPVAEQAWFDFDRLRWKKPAILSRD